METQAKVIDLFEEKLKQIEQRIIGTENEGIIARWEFGKEILLHRKGNEFLPDGFLKQLCRDLNLNEKEVQRRIRFAQMFPSKDNADQAGRDYKTWGRITHEAIIIPKIPRDKKVKKQKRVEPITFNRRLLANLRKKRKEARDVEITRKWRPEAISVAELHEILEWIEKELVAFLKTRMSSLEDVMPEGGQNVLNQ